MESENDLLHGSKISIKIADKTSATRETWAEWKDGVVQLEKSYLEK